MATTLWASSQYNVLGAATVMDVMGGGLVGEESAREACSGEGGDSLGGDHLFFQNSSIYNPNKRMNQFISVKIPDVYLTM